MKAFSGKGMVALTGTVFLVVAGVTAARWGMANAIATDALAVRADLQQRFLQTGELPAPQARQAVYAELQVARGLDPHNPEWMEQASALLLMPVLVSEADLTAKASVSAVPSQQQAIEDLSAAVSARPVSGYAWVNLAAAKYQAGQVDKVLYRALENAARLGPWESDVQLAVLDMGFALWDEMPATLKPAVIQMATNAQQRYAYRVLGIAERRGRIGELCSLPAAAEKVTEKAGQNKLENDAVQLARSRCQRGLAS